MHKIATLKNFAIYFNTGDRVQTFNYAELEKDPETFKEKMRDMIYSDKNIGVSHQFLLEPFSGSLKAKIDTGQLNLDRPRIWMDLLIERISLDFDRNQFLSILSILDKFSLYSKGKQHITLRPKDGIKPTEDPESWWKFVVQSKSNETKKEIDKWKWTYFKERKKK